MPVVVVMVVVVDVIVTVAVERMPMVGSMRRFVRPAAHASSSAATIAGSAAGG